jgi:hypothetical protein
MYTLSAIFSTTVISAAKYGFLNLTVSHKSIHLLSCTYPGPTPLQSPFIQEKILVE